MSAVPGLTINFGANGNSLSYLGGGWARPELRFTWAVGQESHLIVRLTPDDRDLVLTMNVVPFVRGPALPAQRLAVSIDETVIGETEVRRPAMLAWRIPSALIRRSDRTLITFSHPDAARPCDVIDSVDERELAFSVLEARLWHLPSAQAGGQPLPEGLSLGGAVRAGFAIHPGISLQDWVTRRTGLSLAALATRFESLGDNCEFGLVQRRCDTEPLGLLRFSGSFSIDVVTGIEREFEGIGEPATLPRGLRAKGKNANT